MVIIAVGFGRAPWLGLVGFVSLIDALIVGDAIKLEGEDTLFVGVQATHCPAAGWGLSSCRSWCWRWYRRWGWPGRRRWRWRRDA